MAHRPCTVQLLAAIHRERHGGRGSQVETMALHTLHISGVLFLGVIVPYKICLFTD